MSESYEGVQAWTCPQCLQGDHSNHAGGASQGCRAALTDVPRETFCACAWAVEAPSIVEVVRERMRRAFRGEPIPELIGKDIPTYADFYRPAGAPIEPSTADDDLTCDESEHDWRGHELFDGRECVVCGKREVAPEPEDKPVGIAVKTTEREVRITYTVYPFPDPDGALPYATLADIRIVHLRRCRSTAGEGRIERPFLALVSPERYSYIQNKFQTQQRFQAIQVGGEWGMNWTGVILLASDLVGNGEIAFVPVLTLFSIVPL